jgi:hypothetical protein
MVPILVVQSPNGEIHYCNNLTPKKEQEQEQEQSNILETININRENTIYTPYYLFNIQQLSKLKCSVKIICGLDIFKNIYILNIEYDKYGNYFNIIISIISLIISINGYYATVILDKSIFIYYLLYNYINIIYIIIIYINFNISIFIETTPLINNIIYTNNTIYINNIIDTEIFFVEVLLIQLFFVILLQKYYNYMPQLLII